MKTPTRYKIHWGLEGYDLVLDAGGDIVKFTDFTALQEENARLREACKLVDAHLKDLGKSNPGYMGRLVLQDYGLWNEAMISLGRALQQNGGKA